MSKIHCSLSKMRKDHRLGSAQECYDAKAVRRWGRVAIDPAILYAVDNRTARSRHNVYVEASKLTGVINRARGKIEQFTKSGDEAKTQEFKDILDKALARYEVIKKQAVAVEHKEGKEPKTPTEAKPKAKAKPKARATKGADYRMTPMEKAERRRIKKEAEESSGEEPDLPDPEPAPVSDYVRLFNLVGTIRKKIKEAETKGASASELKKLNAELNNTIELVKKTPRPVYKEESESDEEDVKQDQIRDLRRKIESIKADMIDADIPPRPEMDTPEDAKQRKVFMKKIEKIEKQIKNLNK